MPRLSRASTPFTASRHVQGVDGRDNGVPVPAMTNVWSKCSLRKRFQCRGQTRPSFPRVWQPEPQPRGLLDEAAHPDAAIAQMLEQRVCHRCAGEPE